MPLIFLIFVLNTWTFWTDYAPIWTRKFEANGINTTRLLVLKLEVTETNEKQARVKCKRAAKIADDTEQGEHIQEVANYINGTGSTCKKVPTRSTEREAS